MESKTKEEQHVIGGTDQEHSSPGESSLPPSETDGEHSTQNDQASNEEASIDDGMSQGEGGYVAASTEDLHTTQTTSLQSKKISGQGDTMQTTSNNTVESEMSPNEAEADEKLPKRPHHRYRHNLNEDTLKMLKSYLQLDQGEYLDEDAIAVRMLRTDRVTSERIRFYYAYGDSEEDDDDDAALRRAYQAAEDYTLALDFYKKAVADTQAANPNTVIDKRTLNWLRRAMGLHRHNDLWETTPGHLAEQSDESDDEAGSQGPKPRRRTRGMARSTRIRKREQRVTRENMELDALMMAVTDLEEEFGLFPESTSRTKRTRQKNRRYADDTSDEEHDERHRSKSMPSLMTRKSADEDYDFDRVLIAYLSEPEQEVSKSGRPMRRAHRTERTVKVRVVVGGHNIRNTPKPRSFPFLNKKRKRIGSPSSFEKERHKRRAAMRKRRQKALAAEESNKELIFGVMDPVNVMKMDATDYVAESNSVSLGLLEWKRRQLWNPASNTTTTSSHETYQKGVSAVPPKLAAFGISVALPTWETVNPIPDMQRQPTTKEPLRRRHSDATYAEWITKMINCLQRSGRCWAFYEFFYSDIDRAWYNVNEFQVEAAKLGVPPNAKLTRKEWSLVRRSIRSRPRRFSKRFILSEMEKLTAYRHAVRQIQALPSQPMRLSYDVPAYIPVGATVTAFHLMFRSVFRGIVLAHDATRNGYLVQFERQELGYQFTLDTEVASHGVPQILVRATDVTLDGTTLGAFSNRHAGPGALSYGTSYGAMNVDQLDPVERDKKAKDALLDIVTAAGSKSFEADSHDGTQIVSDILNSDAELVISSKKKSDSEAALIEKVAERETLVQLIGTIVAALKRKTMLLDAIEKCHKLLGTNDVPQTEIFAKLNHVFKDHYSWLHANLRMTNLSLESSLLLLQAMYSSGYSGVRSAEIEKEESRALEEKLIKLCQEDEGHMGLAAPWFAAMASASSKVGSRAVSTATTFSKANDLQKKSTTEADGGKLRAQYVGNCLSTACRLLLNVNYCGAFVQSDQREDESDGALALSVGPMKALLEEELKGLVQMPIPLSTGTNVDKLDIANDMRFSAMKDLQEALSCYGTELEVMHVAKKIIHRNADM